jgi:hypothetical protein
MDSTLVITLYSWAFMLHRETKAIATVKKIFFIMDTRLIVKTVDKDIRTKTRIIVSLQGNMNK